MPPATRVASERPVAGSKRGMLIQFLRKPGEVGALSPSSTSLARRMAHGMDLAHARCVIEYGPGTGAMTGVFARSVGLHTKFFAIELNPDLSKIFRQRYPGVKLHVGSCGDVERFCELEGVAPGGVDCILSGLPWAVFPEKLQREILTATVRVLRPGGSLVTFGYHLGRYTPAGRRFAKILPEYFSDVRIAGNVMMNLPPAFVYRCRK